MHSATLRVSASAKAAIDLNSQVAAYWNLVDQPCQGFACASQGIRVVPGKPEASILFLKVSQTQPPCGVQMPASIDAVRTPGGSPVFSGTRFLKRNRISSGAGYRAARRTTNRCRRLVNASWEAEQGQRGRSEWLENEPRLPFVRTMLRLQHMLLRQQQRDGPPRGALTCFISTFQFVATDRVNL